MKKWIRIIPVLALGVALSFSTAEATWGTDISDAKAQASSSGKTILLSFSGSDWCANCMRLEKTLFESEEFKTFAAENYVLLNADFPARKKNKLSAEQTKHNEALAESYNKGGVFPTVLFLSAEGEVLGKLTHPKESVAAYMGQLKAMKAK